MHRAIGTRVRELFCIDQPVAGLDLSDGVARVVLLQREGGRERLVMHGTTEKEPPTLNARRSRGEGLEISNAVLREVRDLWRTLGISSPLVAVAVPTAAALLRRMVLPSVNPAQLRELVTYEVARTIGIDDVAVDFHILREGPDGFLELGVVVVKWARVQYIVERLASIGLQAVAVDVAAYALQNAYTHAYPEDVRRRVLVLHVDTRSVTCVLSYRGAVDWCGDWRGDWSGESSNDCTREDGGDTQLPQMISRALTEANEILARIDSSVTISKVLVGGSADEVAKAVEIVRVEHGIASEEFDPFRCVERGMVGARGIRAPSADFGVSVGLALRHNAMNYRRAVKLKKSNVFLCEGVCGAT